MSWIRRNWRLCLVFLVTGLAMILLLILYIIGKKNDAQKLKAELALLKAANKAKGLEADRKARHKEIENNKELADKLDKEILEAKKKAVAIVKNTSNLSAAGIISEFKRLGY